MHRSPDGDRRRSCDIRYRWTADELQHLPALGIQRGRDSIVQADTLRSVAIQESGVEKAESLGTSLRSA